MLRDVFALTLLLTMRGNAAAIETGLLREDVAILRDALREGHPGLYRYITEKELNQRFEEAVASVREPMTAMDLYRLLAPVVGSIRCGHTTLQPDAATVQALNKTLALFPFDVSILDGKVYLLENKPGSEEALQGAEVISINGQPSAEILRRLLEVTTGDGNSATAGPWRLEQNFLFSKRLYAVAGLQAPFRITYNLRGRNGDTVVEGIPFPVLERSRAAAAKAGATSYRSLDHGIGVLRLASFSGSPEQSRHGPFMPNLSAPRRPRIKR